MDEPLPGTVKLYHRHLFVCTGRQDWPARIESDGGFIQRLSEALLARAGNIPEKVKITACDEPSLDGGYDILIFPDQIRFLAVKEADLPALVEAQFVRGQLCGEIRHRRLTGQHIFVCVHQNRDPRCGTCGPPLAQKFAQEVKKRRIHDSVFVRRTSHVGGHRFAGNVLIYPGGDWYGRVTPQDVPRLIEKHLLGGKILWDLWRGRMGVSPEEQPALVNNV